MSKSEMEKMHTCELYLPGDEDIAWTDCMISI